MGIPSLYISPGGGEIKGDYRLVILDWLMVPVAHELDITIRPHPLLSTGQALAFSRERERGWSASLFDCHIQMDWVLVEVGRRGVCQARGEGYGNESFEFV